MRLLMKKKKYLSLKISGKLKHVSSRGIVLAVSVGYRISLSAPKNRFTSVFDPNRIQSTSMLWTQLNNLF